MLNSVREYRTRHKIGQSELAEKIGVSRQTIHSIETGRFIPSTLLALKLARELKVPVEELFTLELDDA